MQKAKYWKKYWKLFLSLPTLHDNAMSPPRKVSDIFTHSSWRMSELNVYFYKINYMSSLKCSIITGIGKAHRQIYFRVFINTFIERNTGKRLTMCLADIFEYHPSNMWGVIEQPVKLSLRPVKPSGKFVGRGSILGVICVQISNETSQ